MKGPTFSKGKQRQNMENKFQIFKNFIFQNHWAYLNKIWYMYPSIGKEDSRFVEIFGCAFFQWKKTLQIHVVK